MVPTLATSCAATFLARETLRDTEEGTPARMEAEIEYQAALSAYKLIADQV